MKLGEEALENVKMGTNEITGDISVSERKALVLSVPYSKGFTAYVDGKETKLQKANTMFMALELEPGSHEIRLTYCWNGHFCKFVYNKVEIRIAGAVKCLGVKYLLPLTL